jgi:3-oxoacyl-[acyl-carrier protein] reductase
LKAVSPAVFGEPTALCVFLASDASRNVSGRLISAVWDPWRTLEDAASPDIGSDIYTLRRIVPD